MAENERPREGFAGRWSRLKADARAPQPALEPEPVPAPVAVVEPEPTPPEEAEPAKTELPPLETLTKDSDFSLFMRADVADDTRKHALRKLWTMDPHFATIDISECHSIDFNAVPTFPDGLLNTIYRVGSGMVEAVEDIERKEAAEKAAGEKAAADKAAQAQVADSPPEESEKAS
jgi:hypothetical protein